MKQLYGDAANFIMIGFHDFFNNSLFPVHFTHAVQFVRANIYGFFSAMNRIEKSHSLAVAPCYWHSHWEWSEIRCLTSPYIEPSNRIGNRMALVKAELLATFFKIMIFNLIDLRGKSIFVQKKMNFSISIFLFDKLRLRCEMDVVFFIMFEKQKITVHKCIIVASTFGLAMTI